MAGLSTAGLTQDLTGGLRDRLGQVLFASVAGPDGPEHAEQIHLSEGPRWFEADSAIVRVHADAAMFVGGLYALLMQTLHPAAMLAVAENSRYRDDMWGRLHRTGRFIATTTFGTADDAERAVRAVRGIHRRVNGTMPDGTPYAASDPHLLRWVHVSQIHCFLRAFQVYAQAPLDAAERDEYVTQVAEVGRRLGVVDPPTTEAENQQAMADFRPELRGTPEARQAVRDILFRPPMPLVARAPYGVLTAAAVGLMPAWTRWPLRLPWLPVSERTTVRVLGGLATGTIRWAMTPPDGDTDGDTDEGVRAG